MGFWPQRSKEHPSDIVKKNYYFNNLGDDEFIYSAPKYGAPGYLLAISTEELYEDHVAHQEEQ